MENSTSIAGGKRGEPAFCEECLTYGAEDLLLRICLSCGHVGCADGSPSDHAYASHGSHSSAPWRIVYVRDPLAHQTVWSPRESQPDTS